jgi:plasmid stabilization system protein ParE
VTRFRLSQLAERDLEEIADYITEQSGSERAESVLVDILAAADQLAEMPGMGHTRTELTDEDVLFWSVHSFLIVYRRATSPLEVVRVVSGWRDVATALRR